MPPSQVSMQDKECFREEREENEIISDKNQCLRTFLFVSCIRDVQKKVQKRLQKSINFHLQYLVNKA